MEQQPIGKSSFSQHALILKEDGLYARGKNCSGQLGLGHFNKTKKTHKVVSLPNTVKLFVCGFGHSIVLTESGLYSFGYNEFGQLGLGHFMSQAIPTKMKFLPKSIRIIACGSYHSMILAEFVLYVFGFNDCGQLGIESSEKVENPQVLKQFYSKSIRQIACGKKHSMILTDDGLYSFGDNQYGQLGLEHFDKTKFPTKLVKFPPKSVKIIATGADFSMVLTDDGLYSFGKNNSHQIGVDNIMPSATPIKLNIPNSVIMISCGYSHSMVMTEDGIYAIGNNVNGQLGFPKTLRRVNIPQKTDLSGIKSIACGYSHSIIFTCDNTTKVLGSFSPKRNNIVNDLRAKIFPYESDTDVITPPQSPSNSINENNHEQKKLKTNRSFYGANGWIKNQRKEDSGGGIDMGDESTPKSSKVISSDSKTLCDESTRIEGETTEPSKETSNDSINPSDESTQIEGETSEPSKETSNDSINPSDESTPIQGETSKPSKDVSIGSIANTSGSINIEPIKVASPIEKPSVSSDPDISVANIENPLDYLNKNELSNYTIINSNIGSGGYGTVHYASCNGLEVAVKKVELSNTVKSLEDINKEIIILRKLRHKNTLSLIDAFVENGSVYLVTCFYPNGSLDKLLNQKELGKKQFCALAKDICQGLIYIHSCNILHLDLKPQNILIGTEGMEAVIADFGVSKMRVGSTLATKTHVGVCGTFAYMAPETFVDGSASKSSDIYSVGMIFYEMITNKNPWSDFTFPMNMAPFHASMGKRPTFSSRTPEPLKQLIEQMWITDPDKRIFPKEVFDILKTIELNTNIEWNER